MPCEVRYMILLKCFNVYCISTEFDLFLLNFSLKINACHNL